MLSQQLGCCGTQRNFSTVKTTAQQQAEAHSSVAPTFIPPGCVSGRLPVSLLSHSVSTLRLLLRGPLTLLSPPPNQAAGTSPSSMFWSSRTTSRGSRYQSSGSVPACECVCVLQEEGAQTGGGRGKEVLA